MMIGDLSYKLAKKERKKQTHTHTKGIILQKDLVKIDVSEFTAVQNYFTDIEKGQIF